MMPEVFALLAAFCSALSSILLGELKGRMPLLQLIRWQMVATFFMTGLTAVVLGGWTTVGMTQLALLLASGVAGIVVAGTAYIATIHAVGPRITALLFSLTSPFTLILGYVAFGEAIDGWQVTGVALVLAGIVLAIGMPRRFFARGIDRPPMPSPAPAAVPLSPILAPPKSGRLLPGIMLGILTAFGQSIGILLARPAMASGVEPFTSMAIRSGIGALIFTLLSITNGGGRSNPLTDVRSLALVLSAAFIGTTLGMALLMAALTNGNAGLVATLSTMTPVLILPMVWILGREIPSGTAWAGAILAIVGTGLISTI